MLTWALLGARYRRTHLGGAALCIGGLALLVASDSSGDARRPGGYPRAVLGDTLVPPSTFDGLTRHHVKYCWLSSLLVGSTRVRSPAVAAAGIERRLNVPWHLYW